MVRQIVIEDDVYAALVERATAMDMAFRPANDVIKALLEQATPRRPESHAESDRGGAAPSAAAPGSGRADALQRTPVVRNGSVRYPKSRVPGVQGLLDGLRDTIFRISETGMIYHPTTGKWVADPNTVTLKVQDARAGNLRVTVYGRPEDFVGHMGTSYSALKIEPDMAGYSRFLVENEGQLADAKRVIEYSYELKKRRGRLRR